MRISNTSPFLDLFFSSTVTRSMKKQPSFKLIMKSKVFIAAAMFLLLTHAAFSQRTITGHVINADNALDMPGVSIIVKNTTVGTVTDDSGNFSLNVPNNDAIIVVSFIGFQSIEMPVGTQSQFDITLKPDVFALDNVVVSATRTPHSIYAVPASVAVVTKARIEESPALYADETLRGISGVYLKKTKPTDQLTSVTLRGFSGDARTLVLLDGIPLNDGYNQNVNWKAVPTDAISKVEVVKGGFSSLYGGSAMGGVINILTEIPNEEAITLHSNYGTFNTFNSSVSYSNRFLKNKKLSFFITAGQISSDGYPSNLYQAAGSAGEGTIPVTGWQKTTNNKGVDYYLLGHMGDNWMKQTQFYTKLSYSINPTSQLDFSFSSGISSYGYSNSKSYLVNESGRPVNSGSITINDDGVMKKITVNPHNFMQGPGDKTSNSYKLYYKTSINNVSLTSYLGFLNDESSYITLSKGATPDGGPGYINSSSPKWSFIADAQANIPVGNHNLIIGADYKLSRANIREINLSDWRDEETETTFKYSIDGKQEFISPFAQAEINIAEGLKSFLGVRYDYFRNIGGKCKEGDDEETYENTTKGQLSPKLGIVYTPEMELDVFKVKTVRVSAGQSFRTPTLYNLYRTWYSATTTYLSNPNLKPETAFSWEAGIVLSLFSDYTKITFDYYQSYLSSQIYSTEISTGVKQQNNAGKGAIKGFEITLNQNVTSFMDININLTNQSTEITENESDPSSIGKQFTLVPNLIYNIGVNFHKGPASLILSYNYTDKVFSTANNSDIVQGAYGGYDEQKLLDGKFSYKLNKNINMSLSVNNILDKEYYQYYLTSGRSYTIGLIAKF